MKALIRIVDPETVVVSAELSMPMADWMAIDAALSNYSVNVAYNHSIYRLRSLIGKINTAAKDKVCMVAEEPGP